MHRLSAPHPRRGRLLLLVTAALVVAAAVAAAPAAAEPTPTVLTVTPRSSSVNWGATAVLNGVLLTAVDPIQPVDRQQVRVEYSATSGDPWLLAGTVTNTAAPYTSGAYTYSWTAERNYYWRLVYEGTTEWGPQTSVFVLVKVKAAVGKPACPKSVKAGKKFTVSGSLKPHFRKGAKTVTVKAQRYTNGKWKPYKSYKATNADSGKYSKYSVRIKITKKGKYRFYGTTAATSTLAAGKSAYSRTLRVK
jgi:hypothetical protein